MLGTHYSSRSSALSFYKNSELLPVDTHFKVDKAFSRRKKVLVGTIKAFQKNAEHALGTGDLTFLEQALHNLKGWGRTDDSSYPPIEVLKGDCLEVTQALTQKSGKIYTVLNMAHAVSPFGGARQGCSAQEENLTYRSDLFFSATTSKLVKTGDVTLGHDYEYTSADTDLINGKNGRVYLDIKNPRVCIRGAETEDGHGFEFLKQKEYFPFYEIRAAAQDLRVKPGHRPKQFSEVIARSKITAIVDTLRTNNVTHIVLSAFGCGAFENPPQVVARIFKEVLDRPENKNHFQHVVFAIRDNGVSRNYEIFAKEFGVDYLSSPFVASSAEEKGSSTLLTTPYTLFPSSRRSGVPSITDSPEASSLLPHTSEEAANNLILGLKEKEQDLKNKDFILARGNLNNTFKIAFHSAADAEKFKESLIKMHFTKVTYFGNQEKYPMDNHSFIVRFEMQDEALAYLQQKQVPQARELFEMIMNPSLTTEHTPRIR